MARPLRLEYAGALYHVTSRGDRREAIYEDDADREAFMSLLDQVCETCNWLWSSYRATTGQSNPPGCLTSDWLLAAFASRKCDAMERYRKFVREGKGQTSPWPQLRNRVYLGSEAFIDKIQTHIDTDQELSEIPASQRRPVPKSPGHYEQHNQTRNDAIVEAYRSGGYTLKQTGDYFGLHYSTVSGIVRCHKSKT